MNNTFFKQSALIISAIVTGLLVLSVLNGFRPGIGGVSFYYAKWLAGVWLLLAIFRNLKLKKWMRIALAIIPVACIVWLLLDESLLRVSGIYFPNWSNCFIPAVFIPLIGIRPVCGKSIKTNLIVFAFLMTVYLCLPFLRGYQVDQAELFRPFAKPYAITNNLVFAGSIWALISLSGREEFSKALELRWIERVCAGLCIIGICSILICIGINHETLLDLPMLVLANFPALTIFWFVGYPIYRLIKSNQIESRSNEQ